MTVQNLALALMAAAALAGCASPKTHATFVTKTSLALVDVDTAPAGISIAYDRVEGYIGPRLENGEVLPVTGYVNTDGGIFVRNLRQVYASGRAADIVADHTGAKPAGAASAATPGLAEPTPERDRQVLFFGTGTTYGLKVGFQEGGVVPNSFVLGIRRKEISVLPVEKGMLPSVFASIDNTTDTQRKEGARPEIAFGMRQFFATGSAAERIARDPDIGGTIKRHIDQEALYRKAESQQGKDALDALFCLTKLTDPQLERVWNNADDLRVLRPATLKEIRDTNDGLQQRQVYTRDIGLANADSTEHGQRLRLHREAVCELARQTPR